MKLLLLHNNGEEINSSTTQCISLPHPKYNKLIRYILVDNVLYEINNISDSQHPTSSFIDSYVISDTQILQCTPIDPLFVILPFLDKVRLKTKDHSGYYLSYSQIVPSDFPLTNQIFQTNYLLDNICQIKNDGDNNVYRLDDEKLLQWVYKKLERLIKELIKSKQFQFIENQQIIDENTTSSDQISDAQAKSTDDIKSQILKYNFAVLKASLSIIGEYLSEQHFEMLCESLNTTAKQVCERAKKQLNAYDIGTVNDADVNTTRDTMDSASSAKTAKKSRSSSGQSKLSKVNTSGMKKLNSYFTKPKK